MTKIYKVSIAYTIIRDVEVIGGDDMAQSDAVQSALDEDTKIADHTPPGIKAKRELLKSAQFRAVLSVQEIDDENRHVVV